MKKIFTVMLVMMLALTPAMAENADITVFEKMENLMFSEKNVTLTCEAEFTVDGEVFKIFRGEYRQDGTDSYMDVVLDTPFFESMLTGGFTVVANGSDVYSKDIYYGNYFVQGTCIEEDTVLQKDGATEAALHLAKGVLESLGGDAFFVREGNAFTLKTDGAPALVNRLFTYFVKDYIEENMYLGYGPEECLLFSDSIESLISLEYKAVKGTDMPETFIEDAYLADSEDETWLLYYELYNAVMTRAYDEAAKYDGGILWLHEDGETTWHKDYTDYMHATGNVFVDYEDYQKAFRSYYKEKCGEEYTDEMDMILAYTYNFDLWDAHVALMAEMEEAHRKMAAENENAVYMIVRADGSVEYSEKMPQKYEVGDDTITRRLLRKMSRLEIGRCDVRITLDEEGRIAGGEGSAEIAFIRADGTENTVGITFKAEAKDYQSTSVDAFDPADYESCMYEDYVEVEYTEPEMPEVEYIDDNIGQIENLPETVTYAGVTYETMITEP